MIRLLDHSNQVTALLEPNLLKSHIMNVSSFLLICGTIWVQQIFGSNCCLNKRTLLQHTKDIFHG